MPEPAPPPPDPIDVGPTPPMQWRIKIGAKFPTLNSNVEVLLERGGTWHLPELPIRGLNNFRLGNYGDAVKPRPALMMTGGVDGIPIDDCADVAVAGLYVECAGGNPERADFNPSRKDRHGVGVTGKADRVLIEDVTAVGWEKAFCLADVSNAGRKSAAVTFRLCRALYAWSVRNTFGGQGWYVRDNGPGCQILDCLAYRIDYKTGKDTGKTDIYAHGAYLDSEGGNPLLIDGFAAVECSSFGLQCRARGSTARNVFTFDCAMGVLMNGRGCTLENAAIAGPHFHDNPAAGRTYGMGGVTWHATGKMKDVLYLGSPNPEKRYVPPAIDVTRGAPSKPGQEWAYAGEVSADVQNVTVVGYSGKGAAVKGATGVKVIPFAREFALDPKWLAAARAGRPEGSAAAAIAAARKAAGL
jgi:hypothetical protein